MRAPASGYALRPDVRYRLIAGEGVVVRQNQGEVLVLNGVGARMLQLLAQGLSAASIASRLASEYDAAVPQIEADLEAFARELVAAGILERVKASESAEALR